VVALVIEEAVAGGEAAECAGDSVGGMGEVVEGQDPMAVSEGQQSGFGEREGAKGGGGQEPGEAAEPVLGTGKIEK
jgi:hypothetical protein